MQQASDAALVAARERFFSGHDLPEGLVPAPILRSWQRCAQQGLDASAVIHAEPVTAPELRAFHEQNETLRLLSRSELVSLRTEARLTDSVVILTDAKGLVLPGMPAGSPGMEMPDGRSEPYTVELVARDGSTALYARH